MSEQHADDKILHQDAVEDVVDDELKRSSDVTALTDIAAAAGSAPTKTEYDALVVSHNKVLEVLRDSGLIPSA